jgi:hypothetical protein
MRVVRMAAGLGGATAEPAQADAVARSLAEAAGESEFWAVEQLAWGDDAVADVYQQSFNSLTRQCVPALLDGVGCEAGTRVLDVATGPGYVLLSALVSCGTTSTIAAPSAWQRRHESRSTSSMPSVDSDRGMFFCVSVSSVPPPRIGVQCAQAWTFRSRC